MTRLTTHGRREPSVDLATKVAFLSAPRSYRSPTTTSVETIETHVSWLFLTDDRVYKLKKPVRLDYLDFTTLDARRHDCDEEVRLNRRLAPDVYLGVLPLGLDDAGLRLDGDGVIVEWLVEMRRLDRDRLLDVSLRNGTATLADVHRAAAYLAAFYRRAGTVPADPRAYRQAIAADVGRDAWWLRQPEFGLDLKIVDEAIGPLLDAIAANANVLERRAGRIVEGHGDLRPEHVWLGTDGPAVIDCLEFRRDYRLVDPVDELCSLGVECERLGAAWVEPVLIDAYRHATGDDPPAGARNVYAARRAVLRARLAIAHLRDHHVRSTTRWATVAAGHLGVAAARCRRLVDPSVAGGGAVVDVTELNEGTVGVQPVDGLGQEG